MTIDSLQSSYIIQKRECAVYRQWLFVFLGLGWILCCPSHSSTLELDVLIDRIQARYDNTHALTADFVQVATLTSIDRQQRSAGRVYIEKPHSIRWEYVQPDSQTILYDGKTLRVYTPKQQQVLQSTIEEEDRGNVALLFLAGMGKLHETFIISPLSGQDAKMLPLSLLPRSSQASFTELHILVNLESYFVEQLSIYDTIGNITEIRLDLLKVHPELPPQTFELILPPNTEVLTPADFTGRR
jgi:outer membrane lipoprotein carrier protein